MIVNSLETLNDYSACLKGSRFRFNSYSYNQVKDYLFAGRIFSLTSEEDKYLLFNEGPVYRLVLPEDFHADSLEKIKSFCEKKPVLTYAVFSQDSAFELIHERYLSSGFQKVMRINEYGFIRRPAAGSPPGNHIIKKSVRTERDYHTILNLWQSELPEHDRTFCSVDFLKLKEQSGDLFIAYHNDEVAGCCYTERLLKNRVINHLAAKKEDRLKGYGTSLIDRVKAESSGFEIKAWVEENNTASGKCFEKNSFIKTGKFSVRYLLSIE